MYASVCIVSMSKRVMHKNDRPDLHYVSEIVQYAKKCNLTPDEFVWREIYVKLKLAKPPVLMNVLNWYECH